MRPAGRSDAGGGLILLGAAGIALTLIFLCLDFASFDDRSSTASWLLALSVVAVCLGGFVLRSPGAAGTGLATGVFFAALFLFAGAGFAWLKSGYFFPARSRLLLRASLAALAVSATALLGVAVRRRRERLSPPRP
jgi:hypothetical protein